MQVPLEDCFDLTWGIPDLVRDLAPFANVVNKVITLSI